MAERREKQDHGRQQYQDGKAMAGPSPPPKADAGEVDKPWAVHPPPKKIGENEQKSTR
ncbi:MAG: hypothetical protein WAQ25_03325 [Candidatus Saccharimonas sp.]